VVAGGQKLYSHLLQSAALLMNILITGTAGFIGFHVANAFVRDSNSVTGIDNLNHYYNVALKHGRLQAAGIDTTNLPYDTAIQSSTNPNYYFYVLALEDYKALQQLFAEKHFDMVIHLAAQAGVRYSVINPHAYINSNMLGFLNILECCKQYKIKHLVYASSSSVYGMNKEEIFSTGDPVDHPISLYAATKRSNELIAHVYSNMYNLPVTGLRFFTVYGPWGRPDMALSLFTKAIIDGKPIDVYNNGNMLRDFTYIDDIVEGIERVAQHPPKGDAALFAEAPDPSFSSAPYKIYNIGNNKPVKLLYFIEIIEKTVGKKAIKNFMPLQPGDVYKTYADVTPLIEELGYKPDTPIEYGVEQFVNWYCEFYEV
jgi:UDP-glucuronate 4-epimerase